MKSLPETRYSLIYKLHNGQNADAWNEFATLYQPVIFRFCRAKGLQHADATDVTQDVLTKVAIAIDSFDGNGENRNFRGWLYRITRNLVVDFVRKRDKNPHVQFEAAIDLATSMSPSVDESAEFKDAFEYQVFLAASERIRQQVKPATWRAFWETEINQKSPGAVARELDMSTGAVYVARSRILARFKQEVELTLNQTSNMIEGAPTNNSGPMKHPLT